MRPRLIRQVNTGSTLGQIMYRELKASHGVTAADKPATGLGPERDFPKLSPRTWLRQSHGTRIDTICNSAVLLLANRLKRARPPEGIVAISFRRAPMRLAAAVIATVYLLPPPSTRLLSLQALAAETTSFTRQVSPSSETNATEPSVAVDRSDGTVWVAWQASGTHVAGSDDGAHTFVEMPISNLFGV